MKIIIRITLLALLIPTMSYGEDEQHHQIEHVIGVDALSSDLRDLLNQEMRALQSGMQSIIPAYVSGNWDDIATTAGKMKNSYILKQSLTESQIKQLHSLLPVAFIEQDKRFHYLAGMLEHVAKNKNPELTNFYFSKMNEACVTCHSQFATHRFPALLSKNKTSEHSH